MDWMKGMQRAIDYIEDHITEELETAVIAEKAYSSSFHFQRIFGLLTGTSVGEYIRNRRLSLAGEELSAGKVKVIDLAYKYCYDTPESFTKAFVRFHGISPSVSRRMGASLKSYNRLSITITLKGGNIMEYQVRKRESFTVLTKVRSFPSDNNGSMISEFWVESRKDGTIAALCAKAKVGVNSMLGLCEPSKKGEETFRYAIGIECDQNIVAPAGYELWTLPAQTWVVFKCVGELPDSVQKMYKRVYSEFFAQSEYQPLDTVDFEAYPEGDSSSKDYVTEIWVPVK